MSLLRITKFGEPVLVGTARPVTDLGPDTQKLINDMFDTMYAASGIGLAAPQVNVPLRLAVINVTPESRRGQFVIINPKIVKREGSLASEEGCLSLPGAGGATFHRAAKVMVEAVNEKGLPVVISGEGLLARCLQHEIDHLDGKMIIHHASFKRRMEMRWAIRKMKKDGLW